jgi:putative membrane protein insertion efficiency factor
MRTKLSSLPAGILILLVRGYRLLLSPWLGGACRFEPSCSAFSLQALERHGAAAGTYLSVHRVLRCNPLCAGGHDPVPHEAPAIFRHLLTVPASTGGISNSTSTSEPTP